MTQRMNWEKENINSKIKKSGYCSLSGRKSEGWEPETVILSPVQRNKMSRAQRKRNKIRAQELDSTRPQMSNEDYPKLISAAMESASDNPKKNKDDDPAEKNLKLGGLDQDVLSVSSGFSKKNKKRSSKRRNLKSINKRDSLVGVGKQKMKGRGDQLLDVLAHGIRMVNRGVRAIRAK